ncbi:MAG: hypothetical protein NWF07_09480 [Candidatus Bathyarchaeota archaeon]|nr:hypothetical protein [Candidatus Bathyarchaeota archaeon]
MFETDEITEALCEIIEEETGITVKPHDFTINFDGDQLKVYLFNEDLTETMVDLEDVEEDIAYTIIENIERLAKKVTEARIHALEKEIKEKYPYLRELPLHIEDRGHLSKYRHYTTEEEGERDYPELVMVVTINDKEHSFVVDPYQTSEPVSFEEIRKHFP